MKRREVGKYFKREERVIEESDLDENLNLKEELRETNEELAKDPGFLGMPNGWTPAPEPSCTIAGCPIAVA